MFQPQMGKVQNFYGNFGEKKSALSNMAILMKKLKPNDLKFKMFNKIMNRCQKYHYKFNDFPDNDKVFSLSQDLLEETRQKYESLPKDSDMKADCKAEIEFLEDLLSTNKYSYQHIDLKLPEEIAIEEKKKKLFGKK